MSTIAELARLEADEAEQDEQEHDDKQEGDELEPAPAPAPEPEPSEPSDKQLAALDKENVRHLRRVQEIMGGFVEGMQPCSKCHTLGLTPPGPEPRPHENFRQCPTCVGFGRVLTGSIAPGHETYECPGCGGTGFEVKMEQPPAPAIATTTAQQPAGLVYGRPTWMGDPSIASS